MRRFDRWIKAADEAMDGLFREMDRMFGEERSTSATSVSYRITLGTGKTVMVETSKPLTRAETEAVCQQLRRIARRHA